MNAKHLFLATIGTLGLCLLGFAAPVHAQEGYPPPTYHHSANLSDITGPFLGNVTVQVPGSATTVPRAISVWVTLPDLLTQSPNQQSNLMGQNTNTSATLVSAALAFNQSIDKLMPFCGCANPRWRNYNRTVKTAGQLRQALANAVTEQRQMLTSNPTPEQVSAAQKRLKALEDTTFALEKATEVLKALSDALDKAR